MDANPCASVKKPEASTEIVRWLSDDERTALLAACKAFDFDRFVFVRLVRVNDRRAQGRDRCAQMGELDLKRRWATFPRTKNRDARGVPLTTAVCALLKAREDDSELVFPVGITRSWHTAVARAGIQNFRFHDLRHSCGSRTEQMLFGCRRVRPI